MPRPARAAILVTAAVGLIAVASALTRDATPARPVASAARSSCNDEVFEANTFTVCRIDPARDTVALALAGSDGTPFRNFDRLSTNLGSTARTVTFAMNAGMFDETGAPIGLYVESGKQRHTLNRNDGPGNFHMQPNGVFWADGSGAHISTSAKFAAAKDISPTYATQSGPMLVIEGQLHPGISDNGPSRYVRNGVGVTPAGVPVFVISRSPVSFGAFARFFRDALHCPDALYFDGAVSSLWVPSTGRKDERHPLGPLVVVTTVNR